MALNQGNVDLTLRHDRGGSLILGKRAEYVVNITTMLFNTKPGTDEYDSEKGLYIDAKRYQTYTQNTRDSQYESKIVDQFTKYTDLIPISVVATYVNKSLYVNMSVKYQGEIYNMDITADNDTLTAVLQSR